MSEHAPNTTLTSATIGIAATACRSLLAMSAMAASANLLAFGLNTAVTFGLGTRGLLGASTNQQVSAALPTLATPAGWCERARAAKPLDNLAL